MPYVPGALWPRAAIRFDTRLCACERLCGGWQVRTVETDDPSCFPAVEAVLYEHLSRQELMDVLDAYLEQLV